MHIGRIFEKNCRVQYIYLVILLIIIYVFVFGYISIAKYFAMNSDVWDLGYAYGFLSTIAYGHSSYINYFNTLFYQGIVFIIFPIAYFRSLPILLLFQVLILALPIYFIYEISGMYDLRDRTSFLISLSYFFYFPLAGAIWFDFHFQTIFVLLFLMGYFFYLKGKRVSSGVFFVLSGLVRFPYMGIVIFAIFSMVLASLLVKNKTNKTDFKFPEEKKFLFIIFFITVTILILQYLWISNFSSSLNNTHISGNFNPLINFNDKIVTLLIIFGFLLFIPIFSLKWMIPTLPFIFLIFFANNSGYYYPLLFTDWYIVSIVPFLFLGLIEVLSKIQNSTMKSKITFKFKSRKVSSSEHSKTFMLYKRIFRSSFLAKFRKITVKKNAIYFVIVFLIASSTFVEPYGPLNDHSFNNFNTKEELNVNISLYECSVKIINLIPYNEKYVLVQNDLPQLFVHDLYIKNIEVSPYNIGPNITYVDIKLNNFPFYGGNGQTGHIKINYVLVNLNNIHSLTEPPYEKNFPTMDQIFKQLLTSKYYGIEAYGHGIILLKRNYSSPPKIFNISTISIHLKNLQLHGASYKSGKIQFPTSKSGEVSIYGPFPYLNIMPFNYTLSIITSYHLVGNQQFNVSLGYETSPNETFILIKNKNFNLENNTNGFQELLVNFTVKAFLSTFQIDMHSDLNSGLVNITSMTISPDYIERIL